jgi:hypothetical protein
MAVIFAVILLATCDVVKANVTTTMLTNHNLEKAVAYLRTTAYNHDLRMCREAPRVAPNVYWVASDNLLAYKALESHDFELASTIKSRLIEIARTYDLPACLDGLPRSLRYDAIMRHDETLEIPPKEITHITLYNGSYLLRYDIANGTGQFDDWREYADLLLLVALSNHNLGERGNAIGNFTLAAKMWDGTGLRDKAYDLRYGEGQALGNINAYASYKLGLFLYVSAKLGIDLRFENDVVNRIWSVQNQTTGGIYTHILPDGTGGDSDTNTETTAFIILGVSSVQSRSSNSISPDRKMQALVIISVALVVFVLTVYAVRRRRWVSSKFET